jgi:hypothetical protein
VCDCEKNTKLLLQPEHHWYLDALKLDAIPRDWMVVHYIQGDQITFSCDEGRQITVRKMDTPGEYVVITKKAADVHTHLIGGGHRRATFETPIGAPAPAAPRFGELLITLVCGQHRQEAVLGDLAEGFAARARIRGLRNANAWYWWQVAKSVGPFGWRWAQRLVQLQAVLRLIGF